VNDEISRLREQVSALERRLDRTESIEAIRSLRARYHALINEDQGRRLYELFAPDGSVAYNGRPEARGRDAIREFFANFPVQFARQFIHQHVVEVDGDRGRGSCWLDGRPVRDGKSFYVVGRFDDEYVRVGGEWMFARVVLTVHYMIEAAEHWDTLIPLQA
jgi:ketosteroid isomerase-like protein